MVKTTVVGVVALDEKTKALGVLSRERSVSLCWGAWLWGNRQWSVVTWTQC